MAGSFNSWVGVGNATKDGECKYTTGGTAICELSLAINDSYTNKAGQKVESVSYVECVFFGKLAEICGQYVVRGQQILVQGKLKQETWVDKNTNAKRSKLRVIGDVMTMLGKKGDNGGNGGEQRQQRAEPRTDRRSEPQTEAGSHDSFDDAQSAFPTNDEIPF